MTALAYTYIEIIQEVLRRMPKLGWLATADVPGIGTNYIKDVDKFQHSRFDPAEFADTYFYRYNLSGDDRVKLTDLLKVPNDGTLFHGGSSYNDLTDPAYGFVGFHPDRFLGWVMEGQRRQYRLGNEPLVRGDAHDLNMELAGTTYWDSTLGGSAKSLCTVSKSQSEVLYGQSSLGIVASGASWYDLSEKITVYPSRPISMPLVAKLLAGSMTVQLYDATHGALFGTPVTYSGMDWGLLMPQGTTPAGCLQVQLKLSGTSASDSAVVNTCFGPYDGRRQFNLPSNLDEGFKVQYVRTSSYDINLGTNVWAASSRAWDGDYTEKGGDYALEIFRADVLNRNLVFDKHIEMTNPWPLWVAGGPQVSDTEPLDSESAITTQPLDVVADYTILCMAEDLSDNNVHDPRWGATLADYQRKTAIETLVRPRQTKQQGYSRNVVGVWR